MKHTLTADHDHDHDRDTDADDDVMRNAFRSAQDVYDGTNAESDATLQRALFRTRRSERSRQRLTRWIVLPAAAVLIVSSAWAGVTGRLPPVVHSMLETLADEQSVAAPPPTPPSSPRAPSASTPAPVEERGEVAAPAPTGDEEATTITASAQPVLRAAPPPSPAPTTQKKPTSASPSLPKTTSLPKTPPQSAPDDPHAPLFAEAHRLHFTEHDPARSLTAWERYLDAAPNGRFVPEARYNHALALVRLGRRAEAQTELAVFANGQYGNYRREEAKALLSAFAATP